MEYKSAADMNAAVMRIGRVSRAVFEDKAVGTDAPTNPGADHKTFAPSKPIGPRAVDSQDEKIPKMNMPQQSAKKAPGVDDYDDEAETVGDEKTPKKEHIMSKIVKKTGVGSMSEWRQLAGLAPMYESHVPTSGEVPTSGVNKENRRKGGLPGLEGTPMISLDATEYGDNGDEAEQTIDPAPGDLTAEEYNDSFGEFLEGRGISAELFSQLVDEAIASGDPAEMDAILAVEGIWSDLFGKKKPTDTSANVGGIKKARAGVKMGAPGYGSGEAEISPEEYQKQMAVGGGSSEPVQADAPFRSTGPRMEKGKQASIDWGEHGGKQKIQNVEGDDEEESLQFECDSDDDGEPDYRSALGSRQ